MQPTIRITAPEPGLVHINGQFAGETGPDRPLCFPLSPYGPAYLTYLPLTGDGEPLARKLVFSGGALLPESVATAEGLACVAWPGGLLEVELTPARREVTCFALGGRPCLLTRGEDATLAFGALTLSLPTGATRPRLDSSRGVPVLLGELAGGGEYLIALSPGLDACLGQLTARRLIPEGEGFAALVPEGDSVGHGRREQWRVSSAGLECLSAAPVWIDGAPRWPQTPEATAVAAMEAAFAGRWEEARGYLSPALIASDPLSALAEAGDLCLPMRGSAVEGRPCVGLLRVENDHLARVRPLYYRAVPGIGPQGPWQLEALEMEAEA